MDYEKLQTETDFMEAFRKVGALWIHDGNMRRPHALLTSGKHSNGFFNGSRPIEWPNLARVSNRALVRRLFEECIEKHGVNRVVGQAVGSIISGFDIAFMLSSLTNPVKYAFTEKDTDGGMTLKRFALETGEYVLVVEDVVSTGGTTHKTIDEILSHGGVVVPIIATIVNRSGKKELNGRKIVSVIDREMPMWDPDACPFCKRGSEPIRPKGNWDALTKEYPS